MIINKLQVWHGSCYINSVCNENNKNNTIQNNVTEIIKGITDEIDEKEPPREESIIKQDSKKEESDKYIITYYSYENYSFKESKLGIFSSQLYDGLVKIDGVGKVAISEDYDAMPRDVKVVNTVPAIVAENNPKLVDYNSIKTLIVDLDGNGADEYILVLANKSTGYSKITLFDAKGSKVNDLASIEKSKWRKKSYRCRFWTCRTFCFFTTIRIGNKTNFN